MYAELHCKTNFSFLRGASHPGELVEQAAELGYTALAITDRQSLAGVVRAHGAARDRGIKLLPGAEVLLEDGPPLLLWPTHRESYGQLCQLLTLGKRRADKGSCLLCVNDLATYAKGLLAGILPCRATGDTADTTNFLPPVAACHTYRDIFNDRCYLMAELHCGPADRYQFRQLRRLSRDVQLPLVAAGDVHYHLPERLLLQHTLTAIREKTTVSAAGEALQPNRLRHLRPLSEIYQTFADAPEVVARTVEIANRCHFSLDELRYEYPEELVPEGETPFSHLEQLTWHGAARRYPDKIPSRVQQLIEHELDLIRELRYEAYFLTVWDLVRFARERSILCQGRGSAANSAVCYCLEVTSVDPLQMDVLFERFVSRERNEAPDIDVDFEHERREEVLQYIYEKYGRERAGMTAEVITYRPRSAVRDVGKALGLSLDCVDTLAKNIDHRSHDPDLAKRCQLSGIDPEERTGRQLIALVNELVGFPRHLSQHVGGMVITQGHLCELVPIENAAMPDRTVIEWNKDDLDELGILKVDCLALGMLTALRKGFALVQRHWGRHLCLATIPAEDASVYDMICEADTIGVFQIESRAQMSMLPRLRPRTFYDLVIEVAIVRPGPIQGDMVHPYLRRRNGEEEVHFPNAAIEEVLKKTLGVPLFQEQAMRLAVVAAGFTPGEADQLRRAMGAWRRPGVIDQFRQRLLAGMQTQGLTRSFAEHVFTQIRGFGEYGFPESHAASFALLVYASAWLKYHYPAAFTAALLNSQPMGFYASAQLIRDLRQHGVEVRCVDVNHSDWDCTLEPLEPELHSKISSQSTDGSLTSTDNRATWALRLGLRQLVGLSRSDALRIEQARRDGSFRSLDDLARRTRLGRSVLNRLAAADTVRSLNLNRREALWQVLAQPQSEEEQPLLANLAPADEPLPTLPQMQEIDHVYADYRTTGLSLRAHPVSFYRTDLEMLDVVPASALATWPDNTSVRVAGLVLVRQRPSTAKGITFMTLEDETGTSNLVVRPQIWERFYTVAKRASALIAQGILERQGLVIHVVVNRLEDLTQQLEELRTQSRDFR